MTEPNQCSICLEALTESNNTVTECGHHFHSTCLFTQLQHPNHPSNNCPLCRQPLFTPPAINTEPLAVPTGEVDGREDYLDDLNDPFILDILNLGMSPRDVQLQVLRRVHPDNYENIITDTDINNIINSANMYSLQNQVDYQLIASRIRTLFVNILVRQLNNIDREIPPPQNNPPLPVFNMAQMPAQQAIAYNT